MNVKRLVFNPIEENTFILYNDSRQAIIIDPGCCTPAEKQELANCVADNELTVKHIVCTHLHFDHILGVNFACKYFDLPLEANSADQYLLDGYVEQLRLFGFPVQNETAPLIGRNLKEGDTIELGDSTLQVRAAPGHTPGHIILYCPAEKTDESCLFTGDVLFRENIGRTDLPGGNYSQLLQSIESRILSLPDQTVCYPGHGPATTIAHERIFNPYIAK